MSRIHVMAAVIERGNAVFVARRPDHLHQGGKWEFPGGKREADETPLQGLTRELHEELGIDVQAAQPLIRIAHDYPDKAVLLDVWRVSAFAGEPHGREGQAVQWVPRTVLHTLDFPVANRPIVSAVQLPALYAISPDLNDLDDFVRALRATVASGRRLIQIRTRPLTPPEARTLLDALRTLKREHPVQFLCNSALAFAQDWAWSAVFDGLHLTHRDLLAATARPPGMRWLAASCHSPEEIHRAEQWGVDFITLSPVKPTRSHPEAMPLGLDCFGAWAEQARLPVYALGGLDEQDLPAVLALGAQGVAGIRGLWHSGAHGDA